MVRIVHFCLDLIEFEQNLSDAAECAARGVSLKVLLMQNFQTAATVLTHRLPHSAKPHARILPQRGIKMNKAEMNQSEMNAAPSGRKKYPWTLKRVLAWVLIAALVSMYLVTFVLSLSSSPAAGTAFRASLLLTIALPVIAWIFIWAVGALQHRTSIASLKLLNSNPQARKEMEEAVQESEKKEKNNTSKSK